MRDQHLRLKSAIEKLVNATRGDEHPELLSAIFDVAEEAGIDAQRSVQSDATQPRPKHVSGNSQSLTSPVHSEEDITINATTKDLACKAGLQASSGPSSSIPRSASPRRLTCGIWLDPLHYMRISVPPDDILPYLGQRATTLAGILFWSLMDHSQKKCTRKHTEFGTIIKRSLGHSKATKDWATTYIQAMVAARQEYKRMGSISPQYASAAEPDLGMVVRDRILTEYHDRGMDPDQWLSAMGIEKRIKSMVTDNTFATLETAARGEGDPALRELFENIECRLHETSICFGDGPRWSVEVVDGLFLDLLHAAFWSAS